MVGGPIASAAGGTCRLGRGLRRVQRAEALRQRGVLRAHAARHAGDREAVGGAGGAAATARLLGAMARSV